MKSLKIIKQPIAKTTCTTAFCLLIACAAAVKADDQAKSKSASADTRNKGDQTLQGSQSSGSQQGAPGSDSGNQTGGSSTLGTSDKKFVHEAAQGGMMEVQMGTLGAQKAQNPQLKQYAQRLIDDHTKANTELKQLAASKGITLPGDSTGSPSSSSASTSSSDRSRVRDQASEGAEAHGDHSEHAQHQAGLKRLEQLSGAEFDREFVRMAVMDHQKDVKEFEKQAQKSSDPEVKAFAQKQAPILREHLQQAKSLQTQIGQGSSSTGSPSSGSSSTSGQGSNSSRDNSSGSSTPQSGSSGSPTSGSGIK